MRRFWDTRRQFFSFYEHLSTDQLNEIFQQAGPVINAEAEAAKSRGTQILPYCAALVRRRPEFEEQILSGTIGIC